MQREKKENIARAVLVGLFIIVLSSISYAAISGSQHDFTFLGTSNFSNSFGGDNDEPCVYCHTPHGSYGNQTPLWNRTLSFPNGFNVYTSATMDSTPTNPPSTITQLCLSCHDGVGAINSVLNTPGPGSAPLTFNALQNQIGDLGTSAKWVNIGEGDPLVASAVNLTNDHPVSIAWANKGTGFLANPTAPARLVSGMVECTSCHEPHNGTPFELGGMQFMLMSNNGSALCLACHVK